jgi:hypothetical protein
MVKPRSRRLIDVIPRHIIVLEITLERFALWTESCASWLALSPRTIGNAHPLTLAHPTVCAFGAFRAATILQLLREVVVNSGQTPMIVWQDDILRDVEVILLDVIGRLGLTPIHLFEIGAATYTMGHVHTLVIFDATRRQLSGRTRRRRI